MTRKKTTLYMDPKIWHRAKVKAAIQNRTVTEYLNELLEKDTKELDVLK